MYGNLLYFIPRKTPYTVKRGTELAKDFPVEHTQTYEPYKE